MRKPRSTAPVPAAAPAAAPVRTDAAVTTPEGALPSGSRPAAAAFIAPDPTVTAAERRAEERSHPIPFDLEKPSFGEKHEPKPNRARDLVNEALGADLYVTDWSAGWAFHDQYPFVVSRYYPTAEIAVDFPRSWRDVEWVEEKRRIVQAAGIAYLAVMPREALNVNELRTRLAESLRQLPPKGAPRP